MKPNVEPLSAAEEKKRQDEFDRTVREFAIRGGIVGFCLGTSAIIIGNHYIPVVRNLTIPFKAFLISSATTVGLILEGERATFYSPVSRHHHHQQLLEQGEAATEHRHEGEPWYMKARDFALENRYRLTAGIWATTMGVSFYFLYRNPHLGFGQKLVQARVYAQGAVLVGLLATAGLSSLGPRRESPRIRPHMYAWETEDQSALKVPSH